MREGVIPLTSMLRDTLLVFDKQVLNIELKLMFGLMNEVLSNRREKV